MSVQVQENSMEQISERGKRMPGVRKEIYVSGIRIEAVGYRVNSKKATMFRIWANHQNKKNHTCDFPAFQTEIF